MANQTQPQSGKLTFEILGVRMPLQVLRSAAGFYLGTFDESGPVSRESVEYWRTETAARKAFETGEWTQRDEP